MVCILSRLPWLIPSHAHLPPVQLIPDITQKTDVRLQNLAAHAKATSSLKVVMTSCPSESGGGLPASHSIVLPLADESEVFSFQIQHLYKKRQRTLGVCRPPFISLPRALFNTNEYEQMNVPSI